MDLPTVPNGTRFLGSVVAVPASSDNGHVDVDLYLLYGASSGVSGPSGYVLEASVSFAWKPTHSPTIEAFRQYLTHQDRPAWIKGATIHHTYRPVPSTWRGLVSMDALGAFYRDVKAWPAGPHLFLCAGAPDPKHDGIFIGTPLDTVGVHAGTCNSDRWGIEVVGDYDAVPWSAATADLVYGVLLALADFGGYDPAAVNGHRECGSPKTCPGKMINMASVRLEVQRRAAAAVGWEARWGNVAAYHSDWGIAAKWRFEWLAGRPLGKALTAEVPLGDGVVVQWFEHALVTWAADDEVTVWRT